MRWRDFLLPRLLLRKKSREEVDSFPKLTVVIPASNQVETVSQRLPLWLEQNYPDYEVIVVDEASTDGTKELVERYQLRYPNLRYTFVPDTATEICRRKLAITLGIKSARSEWVVVSSASAYPASKEWLMGLSESMHTRCDLVIGYANYAEHHSPYARKAVYERMKMQLRCFRSACGYGAMGGNESNFCIRKSAFLAHRGYADSLHVSFGESHLLIDALATPLNVNVSLSPSALVKEDLPSKEVWKNSRVCYREILNQSSKRAHFYLWREGFASVSLYLFVFTFLAYLGIHIVYLMNSGLYTWKDLGIDTFVLLLLGIFIFLPIMISRLASATLGEYKFGMCVLGYEFRQPFVNLVLKTKRRKLAKALKIK